MNHDVFVLGQPTGVVSEVDYHPVSILSDTARMMLALNDAVRTVFGRAGKHGEPQRTPTIQIKVDRSKDESVQVRIEVSMSVLLIGGRLTLLNCPWCPSTLTSDLAGLVGHIRGHNPPPGAVPAAPKKVVIRAKTPRPPAPKVVKTGPTKRARGPAREHCTANSRRGTGTGMCDALLDQHGNCPRAGEHLD